jgi:tetratricopeptide (TPR) repeat protein
MNRRLHLPLALLLFVGGLQACKSTAPSLPKETVLLPDSVVRAFGMFYAREGADAQKQKNYSQAFSSFTKAEPYFTDERVFSKKDLASLYNAMGLSHHYQSHLDSALIFFTKAVSTDSTFYESWNNIGHLYFLNKDYDASIAFYSRSLAIKPNYETAKENLDLSMRFKSGDLTWYAYGLYSKAGNLEYASNKVKLYTKVIELAPTFVEGYNNLGAALYESGKTDLAIRVMEQAVMVDKKYAMAFNNLGFLYHVKGHELDAINAYLTAISLQENFTLALNNLAVSYYETGEYEKAKQTIEKIFLYDPLNALAKEHDELVTKALNQKLK